MDAKAYLIIAGIAVLFLNPSLLAGLKTTLGGLLGKLAAPKLTIPSGNAAQTSLVNPAQDAIVKIQKRHGLNIVQDLADALIDNSVSVEDAKALIDPILPKLVVYRGAV